MTLFRAFRHLNAVKIRIDNLLYYRFVLGGKGKRSLLVNPIIMDNPDRIFIKDNVVVQKYSWMYCCNDDSKLEIDSYAHIGHFWHCVTLRSIYIGKSVLIADKVFITDCTHNYEDVETPVLDSGVSLIKEVEVGDGSWIGENVSIIGASIGRHCIIGSNSVVTSDIPDYSVAVGAPARVIRKYNIEKKKWEIN